MKYADIVKHMTKKAGAWQDILGSRALAGYSRPFGMVAGLLDAPATENELQDLADSPASLLVPVVGAHREARRRTALSAKYGVGKSKALSEALGKLTAPVLTAGVGAGVGALAKRFLFKDDPRFGYAGPMLMGASAGASVGAGAHVLGTILAALRERRSSKEQGEYENSTLSTLGNYIIPGMAVHNEWKSIGRMIGDDKARQIKQLQKDIAGGANSRG